MEYSPFFLFCFYFICFNSVFIKKEPTQNRAMAKVLSYRVRVKPLCRMRCAYPTYTSQCTYQSRSKPVGRIRPQAASDYKSISPIKPGGRIRSQAASDRKVSGLAIKNSAIRQ